MGCLSRITNAVGATATGVVALVSLESVSRGEFAKDLCRLIRSPNGGISPELTGKICTTLFVEQDKMNWAGVAVTALTALSSAYLIFQAVKCNSAKTTPRQREADVQKQDKRINCLTRLVPGVGAAIMIAVLVQFRLNYLSTLPNKAACLAATSAPSLCEDLEFGQNHPMFHKGQEGALAMTIVTTTIAAAAFLFLAINGGWPKSTAQQQNLEERGTGRPRQATSGSSPKARRRLATTASPQQAAE